MLILLVRSLIFSGLGIANGEICIMITERKVTEISCIAEMTLFATLKDGLRNAMYV